MLDAQLRKEILQHIRDGTYRLTKHAAEEQAKDGIDLQDALHVLKNGVHESKKRCLITSSKIGIMLLEEKRKIQKRPGLLSLLQAR